MSKLLECGESWVRDIELIAVILYNRTAVNDEFATVGGRRLREIATEIRTATLKERAGAEPPEEAEK